jgi:hypothetical protein
MIRIALLFWLVLFNSIPRLPMTGYAPFVVTELAPLKHSHYDRYGQFKVIHTQIQLPVSIYIYMSASNRTGEQTPRAAMCVRIRRVILRQ